MKFPTITQYIEAVSNLNQRLRTAKNITPILDKAGEPLFYASKGVVTFIIGNDGAIDFLRCFTSVLGFERMQNLLAADIIHGEYLENELFVFDSEGIGDYYSVIVQLQSKEAEIRADVYEFMEGLTPFEQGGVWGYNDEKGALIIKPQYDFTGEFEEGRAVVGIGGYFGLINRDGKAILDIEFDEVSWDGSAIAYVDKSGKWGCYDRSGRLIVECKYDWVGEFSQGLLLVKKGGKYGYVNLQGQEAIPLVYDSATSFDENGIASVITIGKRIIINTKGEIEE